MKRCPSCGGQMWQHRVNGGPWHYKCSTAPFCKGSYPVDAYPGDAYQKTYLTKAQRQNIAPQQTFTFKVPKPSSCIPTNTTSQIYNLASNPAPKSGWTEETDEDIYYNNYRPYPSMRVDLAHYPNYDWEDDLITEGYPGDYGDF